ncbi:conserved hypothetical protein [Magnetococcus marinus MC-1]|uniref:Glycosyl transferase, family 2 n=1 Tax=Magnetococcus marinus (strain ATCC BAA-1437 / JCM 17883 / MC-1) TaxID=156889 RepID=A0L4M9_MAGMM|nr:glycosyltransferase family 2 protein [Magnetococcus marinus]ABK42922.1 conserved hypothetical protein [Magnetococcus marinus MC-1]
MEKPCKVVGLVQCKNEWGLIALSITHALRNHVDEVFVLNDSSSDESYQGLLKLQTLFPGRLHLYHMLGDEFLEDSSRTVLMHLSQSAQADWCYTFDADEFLYTTTGVSLKALLSTVAADVGALRYPLYNYLSLDTFDECQLHGYAALQWQAQVTQRAPITLAQIIEGVRQGERNLFTLPFFPKLIVRNDPMLRLHVGAHTVRDFNRTPKRLMHADTVAVVHLPMLSWARLQRKARMGQIFVESGVSPQLGWQNQLVYRMQQEGRLPQMWRQHSLSAEGQLEPDRPRNVVQDRRFVTLIAPTLKFLEEAFQSKDLRVFRGERLQRGAAPESTLPLQSVVRLLHRFMGFEARYDEQLHQPK